MKSAALFLFLAFGIIASVSDIATRRVSNRITSLAFLAAFICYGFLLIETLLGSHQIIWMGLGRRYLPYSFYHLVAIHLILCVIFAVALWYRRIWPAGDAKFFVVASLFLALIRFNIPGFPYWIVLKLAINIFIPAAFFIGAVFVKQQLAAFRSIKLQEIRDRCYRSFRQWAGSAEIPVRGKHIAFLLLRLIVLSALMQILMEKFSRLYSGFPQLVFFLIVYLVWGQLYRFIRLRFVGGFLVLCLIIWGYWFHANLPSLMLHGIFLSIVFAGFFFFLRLLENHIKASRAQKKEISNLSPGDIPSDESWSELFNLCHLAEPPYDLRRYADGLSHEDIDIIRRFCPLDREVMVLETRPFAPWIFLGALWTLYVHETILRLPFAVIGIHK